MADIAVMPALLLAGPLAQTPSPGALPDPDALVPVGSSAPAVLVVAAAVLLAAVTAAFLRWGRRLLALPQDPPSPQEDP